jgi:hypothetical protein
MLRRVSIATDELLMVLSPDGRPTRAPPSAPNHDEKYLRDDGAAPLHVDSFRSEGLAADLTGDTTPGNQPDRASPLEPAPPAVHAVRMQGNVSSAREQELQRRELAVARQEAKLRTWAKDLRAYERLLAAKEAALWRAEERLVSDAIQQASGISRKEAQLEERSRALAAGAGNDGAASVAVSGGASREVRFHATAAARDFGWAQRQKAASLALERSGSSDSFV